MMSNLEFYSAMASYAGGAYKGNLLTWLCIHLNVMKHDLVIVVSKIHTIKHHVTLQFFISDSAVCLMRMFPCPERPRSCPACGYRPQ